MKTGNCASSGREDEAGLVWFSLYTFISSSCWRFLSALYFFWISFICGPWRCRFCIEWICRTVSGTSSSRTITVSATIDQAQVSPIVPCGPSQRRTSRRRFSSGVSGEATISACSIIGRASGHTRSRPRRGSTGCTGAGASRRAANRARARTASAHRARTASRSGGTCTSRARAGRSSSATRRRGRAPGTRAHAGRASRGRLPEDLVDALAEPVEAARVHGLGQAGADDEHVVLVLRQLRQARAKRLAQAALDLVAHDRRPDGLRHREPEPRLATLLAREPVKDEEARRDRAAVPVDRVEVARARESVAALHARVQRGQADRRLRPLARRRLRIARPARVDIRARKPWRRFRLRTLGW